MLISSFINITDFTLSKLIFLICTKSKFLLFCYHSSALDSLFCWTLCTNLPLFGNLWPCHYLCTDVHTALKWLALPQPPHVLQYAGLVSGGALYCNMYSLHHSIPILPNIVTFILVPSNRVKLLAFLHIFLHLLFCSLCLHPLGSH